MSGIVSLCEGVRDALNDAQAGTFSETFSAVFSFAPNYSNIDAKTLRVVVTDAGGDLELITKKHLGMTDSVRVVVLWRVDAGATGIDDELMKRALTLLEEIARFLIGRPVGEYSQDGTARRGDGDKEKSHYMVGNLEARCFAASLIFPYDTKQLRTTEVGS